MNATVPMMTNDWSMDAPDHQDKGTSALRKRCDCLLRHLVQERLVGETAEIRRRLIWRTLKTEANRGVYPTPAFPARGYAMLRVNPRGLSG